MPLSVPGVKSWIQRVKGGHTKYADFLSGKIRSDGLQPGVIADLGCGTMNITRRLAQLFTGSDVYGYDVKVHSSIQEGEPNNLHYGVIEPFTFADQEPKADVVNLGGVVHHIAPQHEERFMHDVRDGMTDGPDNRLFVHEHTLSEQCLRQRIERLLLSTAEFLVNDAGEGMLSEYNFFTRERMLALLENTGFEVLDSQDVGTRLVTIPQLANNTAYWCRKK